MHAGADICVRLSRANAGTTLVIDGQVSTALETGQQVVVRRHSRTLRIIHLRLMGSSDKSIHTGRLRWGRGQWFMGSAFPYVLASGAFRMTEKPYGVGGLLIVAGFLKAMWDRMPRYDDRAFRRDLQRWQYRRLLALLVGKGAR